MKILVGHRRQILGCALDLGAPARVVAKTLRGKRYFAITRCRKRLAGINHFEFGNFVGVFVDQIANPPENFTPGCGCQAGPCSGVE